MSKVTSGSITYAATVAASRDRVTVRLTCAEASALDQSWTYVVLALGGGPASRGRYRHELTLVSVADSECTEIGRDPRLRAACRRLAVRAWQKAIDAAT